MIWQDIAVGTCNIVLTYAMIPEVWGNFKRKRHSVGYQASGITSVGLYIICFAFFTLGLYFAALADFITASLWSVLFLQRVFYK